jgi:hypothetical protein
MRLLALATTSALVLAGCLSTSQTLTPSTQTPPLPPVPGMPIVHRAGALVQETAEQALGAVPKAVERIVGERGGEPNIGVTGKGSIFITAFDFVMKSTDQGATWTKSYEFGSVHGPEGTFLEDPIRDSDPMLWVDQDTDRIFVPLMFPTLVCSEGIYSDDDGATWTDRPMDCGIPGGYDHQKLATGPYTNSSRLKMLPSTNGDYPNVVYLCYNNIRNPQAARTNCAMSNDGGLTYIMDRTASAACGGINGHPATAPNGTVFVPLGANCGQTVVARSFDNGFNWQTLTMHTGGLGSEELDNEVTVTPDGMSYYLFRAHADHRVYMLRSADAFSTVSHPVLVSPPSLTSTRFLAMTSGDDGKLSFAYLGTRDSPGAAGDVYDDARWHMFFTWTDDAEAAEPTFTTIQVTPEDDPVQVGYSWEGGGGDPGRNLLDFIDMVHDMDGRVYVAFTDGCTKDCAGNATASKFSSRARDVALAIQTAGPMLGPGTLAAMPSAARAAPAWDAVASALAMPAG